jgi:dephospho-CoA kinase
VIRIGLTGGIGSGKSTVARRLVELGAILIDSDALAREVVEIDTPGMRQVVERFGPGVLNRDGSLDRAALAEIVFSDGAALADLNAIVHPLVRERSEGLLAGASPDAVVVSDIPLLVENRLQHGFDAVLVVEAPLETRLARLEDRGMDSDEARSRIAAQADDVQRRAAATVVLDNSGTVAELYSQVDEAWARIVRLAPRQAP